MLGDMIGMMGKLKETQHKIVEIKKRLDHVFIDEQSNDGLLRVTLTANRTVKNININAYLMGDKEMLEVYLVNVLNKAIEKATNVNDAKLVVAAKDGMPNIPSMDLFK